MKLSRKRLAELTTWGVQVPRQYFGPKEFGRKLLEEGRPFDWEVGFVEDTSEYVIERVELEPLWTIEERDWEGWYVYDAATHAAWPWIHGTNWATRDRAEQYLALWKEDWWSRD